MASGAIYGDAVTDWGEGGSATVRGGSETSMWVKLLVNGLQWLYTHGL